MPAIVILLLLANIALFAYGQAERGATPEAARLKQQVRPEMIKLLTPQQVAALGPAKVAALADVCVEWGPLSDVDRARAATELEQLALGRLLTQKRADTNTAYWVYLPRITNKTAAEKRSSELAAAGFKNLSVVDNGAQRLAISLGAFRTEEAATAFLHDVQAKGFADAAMGPRQQVLPQTTFVVRDPESAVVARLKAMQIAYPDAETRIGACEKPS